MLCVNYVSVMTSILTQPGTAGWSCCSRYTSEQIVVTSWSASVQHFPLCTTLTPVDLPRRGGKTLHMIKPSWCTYLSCQNLYSTLFPSHTSLVAFLSSLLARLAQYHTGQRFVNSLEARQTRHYRRVPAARSSTSTLGPCNGHQTIELVVHNKRLGLIT